MPLFDRHGRDDLRRHYFEAWRRHRAGQPLEPLDHQIVGVIEQHPEYHAILDDEAGALSRDFTPESGQTNPFLHMGLHLAVREQVATDRPLGIADVYAALLRKIGDPHGAEHRMIEALGEALWRAQRAGRPPDERDYLETLRRLAGRT